LLILEDGAQGIRFAVGEIAKFAGEKIAALAITEPDGGSDVAGLRTTAVRHGDTYLVNGAKTYITSGARADFVTAAARRYPLRWAFKKRPV
jgi:alkylation response protein AidB-like acyl-CoA dehydrogenase